MVPLQTTRKGVIL
uniref:Uncharacterized protein n=1 Tax=Salix viminalis TaxID=40686 RepID=A0A6N2LML0_SALVM